MTGDCNAHISGQNPQRVYESSLTVVIPEGNLSSDSCTLLSVKVDFLPCLQVSTRGTGFA
jgi:hypothetical protein